MERISSGSDGTSGETDVPGVGDDAAARDGQGVEGAVQAIKLSGRAVRRGEVAAPEIPHPAAAIQREALEGRGLLDGGGSRGDEIGRGRGAEGQPARLGSAGRGEAQGHGVAGDGVDEGIGRDPRTGDGHAGEQSGSVGDGDGRGVVHGRGHHRPGAHGGRGERTVFRSREQAEAAGVMSDEAADSVAAVDAEDVRADAIRDLTGDRRIGAHQVRSRGDDIDAVGAGGTSAQRARGAGVQRQRPMQRGALRVDRTDRDARLIAGVLREVPNRLTGDILDRGERLDDSSGRRT